MEGSGWEKHDQENELGKYCSNPGETYRLESRLWQWRIEVTWFPSRLGTYCERSVADDWGLGHKRLEGWEHLKSWGEGGRSVIKTLILITQILNCLIDSHAFC